MKKFARLMVVLFLPMVAQAQEVDASLLKDYIGLTKVLKSHGIDPVGVNWSPVEQACLGLKTETDQVPYNECRLRLVLDGVQYDDDARACNAEGVAAYPEALRVANATTVVTNSSGKSSAIVVNTPMTENEIQSGRLAQFDSCMHARGWNDSNNWQMGRRGE